MEPKQNIRQPLLHTITPSSLPQISISKPQQGVPMVAAIVIIVALMLGGYFGGSTMAKATKDADTSTAPKSGSTTKETVEVATNPGLKEGKCDPKDYPDTTEGTLIDGGKNGEGTHQLEREGGPTKTATLTSSAVDLNGYIGKKVKVCGKTFNSQKVGWLLDIGYIEAIQ
jgi:hypothetical protein